MPTLTAKESAEPEPSSPPPADPSSVVAPSSLQNHSTQVVLHSQPMQARQRTETAVVDQRFLNQIFPAGRSSPIVVGSSSSLVQSGLRAGMTLVEARSLEAEEDSIKRKQSKNGPSTEEAASTGDAVRFCAWQSDADRKSLQHVAELFRQFAPIIAVDTMPIPDSLLMDVTGCGVMFGGEVPLAEQLLKTARDTGLHVRIAMSESVASAWAFTHPSGHFLLNQPRKSNRSRPEAGQADWNLPLIVIPPGQAETWLADLPVAAGRIPLTDVEQLGRLGIRTLKQLLHLPQDDLPSRISDEGRARLRQLRGLDDELLDALPEANPIQALWVSEFGVQGKERLKLVFQVLVEDVVRQLKLRNVGAIQTTCELRTDESDSLTVEASVVKPVQTEQELLDVLSLKLETLRIRDTVMSAKMRLTTAPLPIRRQKDLFCTDEHIRPEEELTSLINRLSSRLSASAVTIVEETSSPVPEQSIQSFPVVESQSGTSAKRKGATIPEQLTSPESTPDQQSHALTRIPIRLLAQPDRVADANVNPLRRGFEWQGTHYAITSVEGPDRIQSRWWDEEAIHRDYYRVTTTVGAVLWLYQDLKSRIWFLHGVFD